MSELTHFDKEGNAIMVDVSEKPVTTRIAVATGKIYVCKEIFKRIQRHEIAKGDVLGVARLAGIMATKRTSELIPLCHPLPLTKCEVNFSLHESTSDKFFEYISTDDRVGLSTKGNTYYIEATCLVKTDGRTGVEMEALTGVQVTLLTIYDMCKAIDKGMVISNVHLVSKSGGKSGAFKWNEALTQEEGVEV